MLIPSSQSPRSQYLFRRRLTGIIALPVLLMLFLAGVSIGQINRLLGAMRWVEHTDYAIAQGNQVYRLFTEVESDVRGYLILGDSEFLTPYQEVDHLATSALQTLTEFVSDNPAQVERLAQVKSQYQAWNQQTPNLLTIQEASQRQALFQARSQQMRAIRNQMLEFIRVEEGLRDMRSRMVRQTTQRVILSSLGLALVLGAVLSYFIWQQIVALSQSYERALKTAHEQTGIAQHSAQRLASLHQIDRAILAAESIESLAEEALSRLGQVVAFDQGAVLLFQSATHQAEILAGEMDSKSPGSVISTSDWIAPELLPWQQPSGYIPDLIPLAPRSPFLIRLVEAGYRSLLTVTMLIQGQAIGSLNLLTTEVNGFRLEDEEIVREVADQLAIAIQQSRFRQELQGYTTELEQRVEERTQQLQTANDELEAFSYTIAHDLRAPLRGIEGYIAALSEDYGDNLDEIAQDYIRQVFSSISRMHALVQDLLTYGRLSREQIQLEPIDLQQVIAEAQFQLATDLQEKQAEIQIEDSLPTVWGQRTLLVQVFSNLLSNAAKFVACGIRPHIRIGAQSAGDRVCVWIKDNGIGIAPQYQEKIFGVFERLHGRDRYPGTGIGLAIVRKGAERLGGHVGVESELSQGSRFWIELQLVQL